MPGPVFDTGLPRAQRTLLRGALAGALSPLLFSNGGYVKGKIRQLPRPLKGDGDEELAWIGNAAQGQAPAIAIALGRGEHKFSGMAAPDIEGTDDVEVAIYVVSNSARNYVEGRLDTDITGAADSTKDPGIEAMLEHVKQYLAGRAFDLATGLVDGGYALPANAPKHVTPGGLELEYEDEVATMGDLTVWELRGHILLQDMINPDRATTTVLVDVWGEHSIEGADPANPIAETDSVLEAP